MSNPTASSSPTHPLAEEAPPRFANGTTPEAPTRPRVALLFVLLTFTALGLVLLRALSGGAPYVMVAGAYFPGWFAAAATGALLSAVTLVALRSFAVTRGAGTGLVYFNCAVIHAFLAWLFLFS